MASSGRQVVVQQDYIAKIRFNNQLPPPPCPPKLLNIPNTGLTSGTYTSASYASRLAREQNLNIEADAELGMPIDLVGIPGVFDGDESAIQALENPPPLHPADRALMRPPNALGKPVSNVSGVSFLRKTEYTTSHTANSNRFEASTSTNTMKIVDARRRQTAAEADAANTMKHIVKGFDLAYPADKGQGEYAGIRVADVSVAEKQAWRTPKHPDASKNVRLLDSYPLIPDWDALPDTGAYMLYKFHKPPTAASGYDERIDVGIIRPIGQDLQAYEKYLAHEEEQRQHPEKLPPIAAYQYEFFLPADKDKVPGIKRNFTTNDPDNEDEIDFDKGVDEEGRPRKCMKYEKIRHYQTKKQVGNLENPYDQFVALALHDPESHQEEKLRSGHALQKAAYFYPIRQETVVEPRRKEFNMELFGEQQKVDIIETAARDPDTEIAKREAIKSRYLST
ncbi:Paf1-domain-containing protein [Amniculicola lignicola CBS 123094]|uniref:Paf1-domain-containing protein n=1 Tax=Amniculicola lignicola CBS 123094 TaxID=1392246 RepID=A0A6A5WZM2_9PLEO|nr:Paf1-domain-containing protein [Amniculicola lignicola CBS 123094]